MLCYRDMTFCKSDCTNTQCSTKLTPDIIASAESWMGSNPPIATANFSNQCPEYIPAKGRLR